MDALMVEFQNLHWFFLWSSGVEGTNVSLTCKTPQMMCLCWSMRNSSLEL